jgi:L-fuconolactonase
MSFPDNPFYSSGSRKTVMQITDSQVHIWQAAHAEKPWPKTGYVPDWAFTPFTAEDLVSQMDAAGVSRAFLVPPAFNGGQNDYSLDAAARYEGRFGVVGRLQLADPLAPAHLEEWKEKPHAYGMRFAFFLPEQQAQLVSGAIDWLWPLAQRLEISLMIYPAQHLLKQIGEIAGRYPSLKLTIDHMAIGYTEHDRDDAAFVHLEQLLGLAQFPNVAIKASALPEFSTKGYPFANLLPYVRRTIDAFGPQRVFWGSDLTRLVCPYHQAVTMFTEHMSWLNEGERRLVMDEGVLRWQGWEAHVKGPAVS